MVGMEVIGKVEERVSKNGNPYKCIVIKITDSCEKVVFLEPAELELLKLLNKEPKNEPFDF